MNILGFFPIPKLGLTVVMRNTSLTTQRKRYTVRTVTRRRPLRVVSTLSAGPFICWYWYIWQLSSRHKNCYVCENTKETLMGSISRKAPRKVKSSRFLKHSFFVHNWNMKLRSKYEFQENLALCTENTQELLITWKIFTTSYFSLVFFPSRCIVNFRLRTCDVKNNIQLRSRWYTKNRASK